MAYPPRPTERVGNKFVPLGILAFAPMEVLGDIVDSTSGPGTLLCIPSPQAICLLRLIRWTENASALKAQYVSRSVVPFDELNWSGRWYKEQMWVLDIVDKKRLFDLTLFYVHISFRLGILPFLWVVTVVSRQIVVIACTATDSNTSNCTKISLLRDTNLSYMLYPNVPWDSYNLTLKMIGIRQCLGVCGGAGAWKGWR